MISSQRDLSSREENTKTAEPSRFIRAMRKAYRTLGFTKGYNFPLFVIFGGAMIGFVLARLSYLNVSGNAPSSFKSGSAPGEYFYYRSGHYRVGIILHLATCLPAGFLMVFQFVPIIRKKLLTFHRINGYLIVLLTSLSNAGAIMICNVSFGGSLDTQRIVGLLGILTTTSLSMAIYNIKRLQIDQHRAWMLRFAFYMGTIITTRIIMIISALIITRLGTFAQIRTCGQIAYIYKNNVGPVKAL